MKIQSQHMRYSSKVHTYLLQQTEYSHMHVSQPSHFLLHTEYKEKDKKLYLHG